MGVRFLEVRPNKRRATAEEAFPLQGMPLPSDKQD